MKRNNILLLATVLLAIGIRTIGILSRPIWYDEAFSILFSEQGPGAMIYGTLSRTPSGSADIHPLGYYTLLWAWMLVFGKSLLAARLLSVLINLISIVLVYNIARVLFDTNTAAAAALLAALLPFQIHFAQEIRMYALLSLWLLSATFSFLQARHGNWKWWIVFSISCALAQYTHNLAVFFLTPLAMTPIFQRDLKTLRSLIPAGFGSLVLYLPWLIHLPEQFSKVNSHYWVEQPGLDKIFTLLLFYLPHLPLPGRMILPGVLFSTLITAITIFQTSLSRKCNHRESKWGIWLAYLAFTPPLLLWLVSQIVPIFVERALLPSHAVFCIWLGWVLTKTRMPRLIQWTMAILITASAGMGIYQHITYNGFPYAPFGAMDNSIKSRLSQGDLIVHSSKLSYLPALYFDPSLPQGYIIDPPNSSVDTLAPATREVLDLTEYNSIDDAAGKGNRIWFVIYQESIDEYVSRDESNHPHLEFLDANFTLQSSETWGDINLLVYTRNIP